MKMILTIAGSDPSGGAGIQADLKTVTSLGCYGAAAVTAITVQNTLGVSYCHPLPPQLVVDQVTAVLTDMAPSHIKIGMTATAEIINALADCLEDFSGEIILDPVLKSSTGQSLLNGDSDKALAPLLARISVLTPNIDELASLSKLPVTNRSESQLAGQAIMTSYPNIKALCIKGGHLHEKDPEVVDILLEKSATNQIVKRNTTRHPRRQTTNSHGTGCSFASAFTAYHARTGCYQQAFQSAVSYVDKLLELGQDEKIGHGTGPLQHYKMVEKN